jgi:hypothetical protein
LVIALNRLEAPWHEYEGTRLVVSTGAVPPVLALDATVPFARSEAKGKWDIKIERWLRIINIRGARECADALFGVRGAVELTA